MKKLILLLILLTVPCVGVKLPLNSFNTGEMSPYLEGRTDVAKYYSGCRTLENFTVLSYGGAERRPGTKYIVAVFASGQYGYGEYGEGVYGE